jgi:2-dehydro-3-deoxygluconokinase
MPVHPDDVGLVTFGESMLRLSPPDYQRLERTASLDVHVAGAESNVAVAANRMGLPSVWTSKLPDTALGRRVTNGLGESGIETEVVWTNEGRQGVYYVEPGPAPRGTDVIYDRDDASVRTVTTDELPTDLVRSADAFYTSGITPALSETVRETTADFLAEASDEDTTTVFDVNYRSKLWSPDEARRGVEPLLELLDVFVVAERDADIVFDVTGSAEETARHFAAEHGISTVVVTRGEEGSLAVHDGDAFERPAYETETVDAVGSGDAFVGGFLAEYVRGTDVGSCLEFGNATAALKRTVPGDMAFVTRDEVTRLVESDTSSIDR